MNRQLSGQRHRRLTADRAGRGGCHRGYGLSCSRKASAPSSCDVRRPYPPHTNISIASLQLSMLDIRLCRGPEYYGRFYGSMLLPLLRRINGYVVRWARRKNRRLAPFKRVKKWWDLLVARHGGLFAH